MPEVRIVLIYFVGASAWIIGSDCILTLSHFSGTEVAFIQSLKGLNFVVTTALLLYLVLRRAYGGWRLAEQRRLNVLSRANERFRNLSLRIQSLQEQERTRISREIHDELGQLLTGIKMEIRSVENRLADRDDRTLNGQIDQLVEISEMVDASIDSVRRISHGLRPSALDHLGLGAAITEEAASFATRSGITCTVAISEIPESLSEEVVSTAFRIFQEALTNVARHSGALQVTGNLDVTADVLNLRVADNGSGFDPSILEDNRSLGLIGMRERAESVGGSVRIIRLDTGGTEIILSIPLQRGSPPRNPHHENSDHR